jgi:HlyD family secretion protein
MKKWVKPAAFVAVVLVALAAVYVRGRAPDETAEAAPDFELAERRSLEVTAEASGLIEPMRLVEVKSKASGEIKRLLVETGDVVRRGQLLAEVDPRDVRNAYAQAEADLEVARARLTTSEAQKKRSTELRAANVITEQEFEAATFEEANARAQFVKARTSLELAQERMSDVTIQAPIDGVIIRKDVEEGQIIQSASQNISGGTTVLMMADLSQMQVRTLVNETDLGKIQPGLAARVAVEAFPGRTFVGTVLKIEPQAVVEQNVTMFPVLVQLENRDGSLKPGMNAEVIVEVARRENVVTVPNAAIVSTRDAEAAGSLFGLDEEQMRTALRSGRGSGQEGSLESQPDAGTVSAPTPTAAANGANGAGSAAAAPAAGAPQQAAPGARAELTPECQALRERVTAAGFANAAEEDRTKLRACMQAAGLQPRGDRSGARASGAQAVGPQQGRPGSDRPGAAGQGRRGGIGNADVRPGVVFVRSDAGVIEPRTVMLGVNDWDYTEVIRGIQPGERVVLISVARLQQQQQQMLDRMRERNSGLFPSGGGPGGGGGGQGGARRGG